MYICCGRLTIHIIRGGSQDLWFCIYKGCLRCTIQIISRILSRLSIYIGGGLRLCNVCRLTLNICCLRLALYISLSWLYICGLRCTLYVCGLRLAILIIDFISWNSDRCITLNYSGLILVDNIRVCIYYRSFLITILRY